jgi:DNA-binding NarL/FixJ family response regulator
MEPVRLLIVDDHRMFADGLRLLLSVEDDIDVIGAVTTGRAAIEACTVERPDVALVDVDLPDMDGVAAASAIVTGVTGTKVVVVSALSTPEVVGRAIEAGAVGFVSKERAADDLVRILRSAAEDGTFVHAVNVVELVPQPEESRGRGAAPGIGLSKREMDVLQGLADGLSTTELAQALYVSPRTVQGHVQSILTKLGVRSKLEAVLGGLRLGIVRLGAPRKRIG